MFIVVIRFSEFDSLQPRVFSKLIKSAGTYLPIDLSLFALRWSSSSYSRLSSFLEAAWSSSNLHLFSASRCNLTRAANFVSSSCRASLRDIAIFSRDFLSAVSLQPSFPVFDDWSLSNKRTSNHREIVREWKSWWMRKACRVDYGRLN